MNEATPAGHPCSICGKPTASQFAMCQRPGACSREYRRLWNQREDKERRNALVRRYRRNHKCEPYVYAILFPVPGVLKVGNTTTTAAGIVMGMARTGARKRGWNTAGSLILWQQPGDVRVEAWMQATLAFRWPGAFRKYQNRICEWFDVSGLSAESITVALDKIYRKIPVDLVRGATFTVVA